MHPILLSRRRFIPLLLVAGLFISVNTLRADDESSIRSTFATFKSSVLAGNTTQAAKLLAPSALDYFERLKPLAMNAKPLPTDLPVVDHLLVEVLRQRAQGQVQGKDLAAVAAEGMQAGWIQVKGLEDVALGSVTVTGHSASGVLIVKNAPTNWSVPFAKNGDGWKIDPLAYYTLGDFLLKAEMARNGFNEKKTIDSVVASMPRKKT